MTKQMLLTFGATRGAFSVVTNREATGDRSVTLDRHEKSVIHVYYPDGSFARKGGAKPMGLPVRHKLLVNPHDQFTGSTVRNVNIVHPKKTGNELRLYEAGSGLTLKSYDYFYIFYRKGDPFPTIGTLSPATYTTLSKVTTSQIGSSTHLPFIDDEEEDAAYQKALNDVAAKTKSLFSGERYPRNPNVAVDAIKSASFVCEAPAGDTHATFTSAASGLPFVEAHHLIPLAHQGNFEKSLDVNANIVALCPNCHRRLHHARIEERIDILVDLFKKREHLLRSRGIIISEMELLGYYGIHASGLLSHLKSKN